MNKIMNVGVLFLIIIAGCQGRKVGNDDNSGTENLNFDKNAVVFSKLTDGNWQVWSVLADGTKAKQLTFSKTDKRYPCWADDGKSVYFRTANYEIFKLDMNSLEEKQILQGIGLCEKIITQNSGKEVLAVIKSIGHDSASIWYYSEDMKSKTPIGGNDVYQYDPAISPDGNTVVYISGNGHHHSDEMIMLDRQTGETKKMTANSYQEFAPEFSPDGKSIAYTYDKLLDHDIWVMDSDGTNQHCLFKRNGMDIKPSWSPDGKYLVFASENDGVMNLAIVSSKGTGYKVIVNDAPSIDPCWYKGVGK